MTSIFHWTAHDLGTRVTDPLTLWNNVAALSPKSGTTTASSMRRGPGKVKNCLCQTFLLLWWLNNFFLFKTFFGIHANKASVNTEDLKGAWLNLMTNKNALKSVESCLLGDKIRNEVIRPRAVVLLSPEPCEGSEKVKSCSRPTVTPKRKIRDCL